MAAGAGRARELLLVSVGYGGVVIAAMWLADYLGAHAENAGRFLGFLVVNIAAYLIFRWFERRRTRLRVSLTIEARSKSRLWIAGGGYEADVSAAIIGAADKWKARWSAAEGNERLRRRLLRREQWLVPACHWQFLFLGSPADPDTLIWRREGKSFGSAEFLVYDKLWTRLLAGTKQQEREPYFIVKLHRWPGPRVLRVYLGSVHVLFGEERPEQTLCELPLELLLPIGPRREQELLARYGMNKHVGYPNAYEHKWFTFTVNVERLRDGVAV